MAIIKTISSWLSFYGVVLMLGLFLYSLARLFQARAAYWRERAKSERLKTNIVKDCRR